MIVSAPSIPAISRLLRPRSVAIVGASPTPGALGASVLSNLVRTGFPGEIHLINPKRDEIGGRRCLKSPEELPDDVDVAVLAIPRPAVLPAVRALAQRRVGAIIIFSAGFAESGETGLAEQREIARLAREHGILVEGPNCLGMVNYVDGTPLTFVETTPELLAGRPGIGLVSQSGAMACVLGVTLASRHLGMSYSVSTGNEAASSVEDYVEFLVDDPDTRVIGMIVEQFRQPQRFLAAARRARAAGKAIVLLHPGRSSAARASAATHTGAMAGDYAVMRTVVERAGVAMVDNLEELGDVLELALRCPPPAQGGAAVVTESGAFKALTLDLCEQIGLDLPALAADDAPALRAAMPEFIPVSNPLDLTAQALVDPDLYRRTLSALAGDARFAAIVLAIIQTDRTTCDLKFPPIISALRKLRIGKPVIFAGLDEGASVPSEYIDELRALGVPYFPSSDRVFRALTRFCQWSTRDLATTSAAPDRTEPVPPEVCSSGGTTSVSSELANCPFGNALRAVDLAGSDGVIAEYRAKAILGPIGIPFPRGRFVTTLEDAQRVAAEIGFPVVLKAQSAALSHKSDAGGVVLNLRDAAALAEGWTRLHANIARHQPDLVLDGVLVEAMGARGVELIVGARHDPDWGPVILVGFGGVTAEVLHDVRLLAPDLTREAIVRELSKLKQAPLLSGFRGSPALDVDAVAEVVMQLGRLLLAAPSIREIDLNPVVVYPAGQGAVALDALMLVGPSQAPANHE